MMVKMIDKSSVFGKTNGRKTTEAPGLEREQKLHLAKVRDQMFIQRWPLRVGRREMDTNEDPLRDFNFGWFHT